MFANSQPTSEK